MGLPGAVFMRAPGSTNDHDLGLFSIGEQARNLQRPVEPLSASTTSPGKSKPWLTSRNWRDGSADAGSLVGASDHGTTKSLYAKDPDGLEFEVAWVLPADLIDETALAARSRIGPLDLEQEKSRYGRFHPRRHRYLPDLSRASSSDCRGRRRAPRPGQVAEHHKHHEGHCHRHVQHPTAWRRQVPAPRCPTEPGQPPPQPPRKRWLGRGRSRAASDRNAGAPAAQVARGPAAERAIEPGQGVERAGRRKVVPKRVRQGDTAGHQAKRGRGTESGAPTPASAHVARSGRSGRSGRGPATGLVGRLGDEAEALRRDPVDERTDDLV